jgi:DNA-binding transcriptional MerR regulator/effector-binding domain-containing protein
MSSPALLSIGDFSRATQLSVKMLRHYHQIGLLEPVDVDRASGYRRYSTDQISTAHIIRRFRALEMPLDEIRTVMSTTDLRRRNELINAHLMRLESQLAHTNRAVESLRELLEPGPTADGRIGYRRVEATEAVAISEVVDASDAMTWVQGAQAELYAILTAQGARIRGPAGGIFDCDELIANERGLVTVFVPFAGDIRRTGRLTELVVPAAELVTVVHAGSYDDADLAYGALATHVAQHAITIDGPIREYFLVGPHDTRDETAWRTEIGWPVFHTTTA